MAQSLHRLLRARARVRWDLLTPLAALLVAASVVNTWWTTDAVFAKVTFAAFFPNLASLMLLFLLASATLPDEVPAEGLGLKDYYLATRRYFWVSSSCGLLPWSPRRTDMQFGYQLQAAGAHGHLGGCSHPSCLSGASHADARHYLGASPATPGGILRGAREGDASARLKPGRSDPPGGRGRASCRSGPDLHSCARRGIFCCTEAAQEAGRASSYTSGESSDASDTGWRASQGFAAHLPDARTQASGLDRRSHA
jgi:hypothetical protein